jgi:hypothetical protein
VPRGPADRPIAPVDAESASLRAALRQAQERGAAPATPGHTPEPDRPGHATRVEETRSAEGPRAPERNRGARSFVLGRKRDRKKRPEAAGERARDPGRRGRKVDTLG